MKRALDNPGLGVKVIDVRESDEYEIAHVTGVSLFPLSTLGQRFAELDPDQRYYIHCKSGARSMKALQFLREPPHLFRVHDRLRHSLSFRCRF